jgi:hypothetical protein
MSKKIIFSMVFLTALSVMLTACGVLFVPVTGGEDVQSVQQTAVVQTVSAVMTQQAFETLVAQATQMANQPTATPTQEPSPTPNEPTPVPPTATSTQVPPTATPTQKPIPCGWAQFVSDVTVADGSQFTGGQKFTKTWRLKNIGICTWTKDYALVFVDGNAMSAPASISLKGDVRPGETVDLSVELVAPNTQGSYKANWILRDGSGKLFGLGEDANKPFWVSIRVSGYKSDDVPSSIYPYDLVASICQAKWVSNAGKVSAPCAGLSLNENQWAAVQMNPKFEGGRQENERSVWVHLAAPGDWVQGFYPAWTVKNGERFVGWVGCMDGNEQCEVTFSLDYRLEDGKVENLAKWAESRDGKWTQVELDLSQFDGKKVEFILGVSNKNSRGPVDVFWFIPSIISSSSSE